MKEKDQKENILDIIVAQSWGKNIVKQNFPILFEHALGLIKIKNQKDGLNQLMFKDICHSSYSYNRNQ
mgnify:CR=1 FL=1